MTIERGIFVRISKENIHSTTIRCKNTMQITLDDDFNVPDYKDDIENIVKEWGNVRVDNVKASGDRADVSGCMDFSLLYIGTGSNNSKERSRAIPVNMSGSMNFNESVNLTEDSDSAYVSCLAKIEDLTIKTINSRKISVKAIISITVVCEEINDASVGCEVEDEDNSQQIRVLNKNINYTQLAVNLHDNLRIRQNIAMPSSKPEIAEILWDDTEVRNLSSRLTDEGITITGELGVFIMYVSKEEEAMAQWYETAAAFEGKLDINGCNGDMISCVSYSVVGKNIEIKPDFDGENREVSVELVLDLSVKAYEECQKNIIADMYSPVKNVKLITQPCSFKKLLMRNNSKCRASERVKVPDYVHMLQICNCTGTAQIDDVTVEEDGLQVDGAIIANVFYITADDNAPMGSIRAAVPFSNKIQLDMGEEVEYTLDACIDQLTAAMTGSDGIEIKGCIALEAVVFEQYTEEVVEDCAVEEYDESEFLKFPGIIGYIANGEDTVWDVAKRYHTTTESIRNSNSILADRTSDDARLKKGEKLLLVKSGR